MTTLPRTTAQRQADFRRRLRALGLVAVTVWVLPAARARVQRFAEQFSTAEPRNRKQGFHP